MCVWKPRIKTFLGLGEYAFCPNYANILADNGKVNLNMKKMNS